MLNNVEKVEEIGSILKSLKIKCEKVKIEESEYFDKYSVRLKQGEKYIKLEKSLPDIGMALKAQAIPIGYPIIKEGIYRFEVQKKELKSKYYRDLKKVRTKGYSSVSLGVDNYGEPFSVDLQSLPNLLIGGTPGAGKSMLLHSIILSLIEEGSKLFLVDPKMVEFNIYEKSKSVVKMVNDVEGFYELLDAVSNIMNSRFERLSRKGYRDVHAYNKDARKPMRPVVVIVDEWADIILQDGKVQKPLCRIAQKGRAAGISIILATQRPSSKVIPGLIKANFSGRIALRVASYRDSMIVLDKKGAEKLQDIGSGLYIDHRSAEPVFFRSPYIENLLEEKKETSSSVNDEKFSFFKRFFK